MTPRSSGSRACAVPLVLALVVASNPAFATAPALLEGSIVAGAPLDGARVELADRRGTIVAGAAVSGTGDFQIEAVPAGTYRLAVTTPTGAYAAGSTLTLAPGSRQKVQVAVKQSGKGGGSGSDGFWDGPWGKASGVAIIVGGVLAVAALVDNSGDSATPATASPSEPLPGR